MRAGAECAAGVDHDAGLAGIGLLPRRPDPEAARPHRTVKRAPAVLPARQHRRHLGSRERDEQALHGLLLHVERNRQRAGGLGLLEAAGRQPERECTQLLRRDREAPTRRRGRDGPSSAARTGGSHANPRAGPRTARTSRTVNANGSCGAISSSACATIARFESPLPISAIVRCGTGSRSPSRTRFGEAVAGSGDQRDEVLVRLRGEPDVAREGPTPTSSASNDVNAAKCSASAAARRSSASKSRENGGRTVMCGGSGARQLAAGGAARKSPTRSLGRNRHEHG